MAILFVMFLHAYFSPWATTAHTEVTALRLVHLLTHAAVPVYLFMSGFLGVRDRSAHFGAFVVRRLHRLGLPMVVWMAAALLFDAWWPGTATWAERLRAFALFNSSGQFYFLLVLFVLTLASYAVRGWSERRLRWLTVAAFVVNLAAIVYYQSHEIAGLFAIVAYRNPLVWVFSFTFGLYLGRARGHLVWSRRITVAAAAGMAVIAMIYAAQGERGGGYPISYFGVTVFLFAALGLVVFPAALRGLGRTRTGHAMLAPARALAPYAFAIYLVHKPYFVGYLSDRLISNGPLADDYLKLMTSLFVMGGVASIAFVIAVDRVAPRFAALALGVERPRRRPAREVRPAA
ncbi:MAG: hypothetical protein EXR65_04490 [Dehalococcoidia bacterium]|nr:hypothetical protein [Dehalococcoidia bacterium]